jgi:hypothetical protein
MFGFCFRKSSIAILAATTDPCPLESESGPVASLTTPILTTPSEISTARTGDPKATKPANTKAANALLHPRLEALTSFSLKVRPASYGRPSNMSGAGVAHGDRSALPIDMRPKRFRKPPTGAADELRHQRPAYRKMGLPPITWIAKATAGAFPFRSNRNGALESCFDACSSRKPVIHPGSSPGQAFVRKRSNAHRRWKRRPF